MRLIPVEDGTRFNKWTVLSRYGCKDGGGGYYTCRCDCGSERVVSGSALRSGKSIGCKTCSGKRGAEAFAWKGHGELSKSYWGKVRFGAIGRDIPFEVTIEYGWELFLAQNRKCKFSGRELSLSKSDFTASLDRIDSSIGYFPGNVQWVHRDANYAKRTMRDDDFFELCKEIADHQRNKSQRKSIWFGVVESMQNENADAQCLNPVHPLARVGE